MFLTRQNGLGRDRELITLRRRTRNRVLLLFAGGICALVLSLFLLGDRRGTLIVKADQSDAHIVLNGALTNVKVGTPIKHLRSDIYGVSVSLPGFQPNPVSRIVKVEAGRKQELFFTLTPIPPEPPAEQLVLPKRETESFDQPSRKISEPISEPLLKETKLFAASRQLSGEDVEEKHQGMLEVVTRPVQGGIFVDDIFKGAGKVTLTDLSLGEVVVRFGDVQGYRTPESQKAFLSPPQPTATIEGIYLPLIYVNAYLDQAGRVITQKCDITQGYILEDETPQPDPMTGPAIKFVDEVRLFAWEIGYAFSNRNPPGQDYIEMTFDLPENWDGNKPLELQLYGYTSNRKYPFALAGRTSIDIIVNDRVVKSDHLPTAKLAENAPSEYDVIPVNAFLKMGKNYIRIQASVGSRCFYYLRQIVLL